MKKLIIALAMLFACIPAAAQEADTVWTRNMDGKVIRLDFLHNGNDILCSAFSGVFLLNSANGEIKKIYTFGGKYDIFADENRVIIPDFKIFDLTTGNAIDSFYIPDDRLKYFNGDTTLPYEEGGFGYLRLSPDNRYLVTTWGSRVYFPNCQILDVNKLIFIDIIERRIIKIVDYYLEKYTTALEFSPDGNYLAVGFNNGEIELWDGRNFEFVKEFPKLEWDVTQLEFMDNLLLIVCDYKLLIYDFINNDIILKKDSLALEKIVFCKFYKNKNDILYIMSNYWENEFSMIKFNLSTKLKKIVMDKQIIPDYIFMFNFAISPYEESVVASYYNINLHKFGIAKLSFFSDTIYTDINNNSVIYPNPATNKAHIKIYLPNPEQIEVTIFDINGLKLLENDREYILTGPNTIEIDVTTLPAGAYFIKISNQRNTRTYKLIKEY